MSGFPSILGGKKLSFHFGLDDVFPFIERIKSLRGEIVVTSKPRKNLKHFRTCLGDDAFSHIDSLYAPLVDGKR